MYFQLEVDYCSNEANKNKYKNVQLIGSTKNNLEDSCRLYMALYLQPQLATLCCLGSLLLGNVFIELKSIHLFSINVGVSLLHGLIVASIRINKIYIKIDKVKIKPYLHQNHSIG